MRGESKAGCKMRAGCSASARPIPPRARGSVLREAAGDNHCHLQLFRHNHVQHPFPLSPLGISVLQAPPPPQRQSRRPSPGRHQVGGSKRGLWVGEERVSQLGRHKCREPRRESGRGVSICFHLPEACASVFPPPLGSGVKGGALAS